MSMQPRAAAAKRERVRIPALLDRSYGYHVAKRRAQLTRALYDRVLTARLTRPVRSPAELDLHVAAFSGARDLLEQLVSLRSLLLFVGRPARLTLGSDGTHADADVRLLRRLYGDIEVVGPSEYAGARAARPVRAYAAEDPFGRKLAFEIWVSRANGGPLLFADSDVLFFPGAATIRRILEVPAEEPRFLLDCMRSLDDRVLPPDLAAAPPVNSGFWLLKRGLCWEESVRCLEALDGPYGSHTEQTLFQTAIHRAGGVPLDSTRFVMRVDDRFRYRTRYERTTIALRHYVTNIRHQFWLNATA
jgi:hypothetical protein